MNCPVCGLDMPDELVKVHPCEKCGCMDLMDDLPRKEARKRKDIEGALLKIFRGKKELLK